MEDEVKTYYWYTFFHTQQHTRGNYFFFHHILIQFNELFDKKNIFDLF